MRRCLSLIFILGATGMARSACNAPAGDPGDYTAAQVSAFLASGEAGKLLVVNRGFTLPKGASLRRPVEVMPPQHGPITIDLNGGRINPSDNGGNVLAIRSRKNGDGSWCQLREVTVKNGTIEGAVRVYGLGENGQGGDVVMSSRSAGHIERAQSAAPTQVILDSLTLVGHGRIPLYLAPGVTYVTTSNSRFTGARSATTIYLDGESAYNRFLNNDFATQTTGSREVFAIDGSAHNLIQGNRFPSTPHGGIFIYRNCGEGGAPRHQEPRYNEIADNTFLYTNFTGTKPAIWLGSRQTKTFNHYCEDDARYPYGSGLDDHDFARNNKVIRNNTTGRSLSAAIVNNDIENTVTGNFNNSNSSLIFARGAKPGVSRHPAVATCLMSRDNCFTPIDILGRTTWNR